MSKPDPIRVNSDSWTGLDPSRAAKKTGWTAEKHRGRAKVFFVLAGFFLILSGYRLATPDDWFAVVPSLIFAVYTIWQGLFHLREGYDAR